MNSIICENNTVALIEQINKYLQEHGKIGGIIIVDATDDQLVLLADENQINQGCATAWWDGFQAALKL